MFAGSINKGTEIEKQRDDGLVERHAYSIIRVARITSVPGFIGLVQCRNPWGNNFEWNGDWSDRSPLWDKHPEVGKEIGRKYLSADDGLFWMAWKDFRGSLTRCRCARAGWTRRAARTEGAGLAARRLCHPLCDLGRPARSAPRRPSRRRRLQ